MKPQRDKKPDKEKFKQRSTGPEVCWCAWIRPLSKDPCERGCWQPGDRDRQRQKEKHYAQKIRGARRSPTRPCGGPRSGGFAEQS